MEQVLGRLHQEPSGIFGKRVDPANYKVTAKLLATKGKSDSIVLHSLRVWMNDSRRGSDASCPLLQEAFYGL